MSGRGGLPGKSGRRAGGAKKARVGDVGLLRRELEVKAVVADVPALVLRLETSGAARNFRGMRRDRRYDLPDRRFPRLPLADRALRHRPQQWLDQPSRLQERGRPSSRHLRRCPHPVHLRAS